MREAPWRVVGAPRASGFPASVSVRDGRFQRWFGLWPWLAFFFRLARFLLERFDMGFGYLSVSLAVKRWCIAGWSMRPAGLGHVNCAPAQPGAPVGCLRNSCR